MFQKIDNLLFKICERLVLKRVKKSKFKKHKYHIEEGWQQFELAFLICAMIFDIVIEISRGHFVSGSAIIIMWGILVFLKIATLKVRKGIIEAYDWLWNNRKNPEVYNTIKRMCAENFEKEKKARTKAVSVDIFFAIFLIGLQLAAGNYTFITLWLAFSYPLSIITIYLRYVFDFDPPEEKKKEADSKLTNIMQQQLEKLFKDIVPKPI